MDNHLPCLRSLSIRYLQQQARVAQAREEVAAQRLQTHNPPFLQRVTQVVREPGGPDRGQGARDKGVTPCSPLEVAATRVHRSTDRSTGPGQLARLTTTI